jgi:hypothetical protein
MRSLVSAGAVRPLPNIPAGGYLAAIGFFRSSQPAGVSRQSFD